MKLCQISYGFRNGIIDRWKRQNSESMESKQSGNDDVHDVYDYRKQLMASSFIREMEIIVCLPVMFTNNIENLFWVCRLLIQPDWLLLVTALFICGTLLSERLSDSWIQGTIFCLALFSAILCLCVGFIFLM